MQFMVVFLAFAQDKPLFLARSGICLEIFKRQWNQYNKKSSLQ